MIRSAPRRPALPALATTAAAMLLSGIAAAQSPTDVKLKPIAHTEFNGVSIDGTPQTQPNAALWDERNWTAWTAQDGEHTTIEVKFSTVRYIARIEILTGDGSGVDAWRQSRRAGLVTVAADGREPFSINLQDTSAIQPIDFPEPLVTNQISLRLDGTWGYGPIVLSKLLFLEPEDVFALQPNLRQEIESLVTLLEEPATRQQATEALIAVGPPARPWIIRAIEQGPPGAQAAATELLTMTASKEGVEPVVGAVRHMVKNHPEQSPVPDDKAAFARAALQYLTQHHGLRASIMARSLHKSAPWRTALGEQILKTIAAHPHKETLAVLTDAVRSDNDTLVQLALPSFAGLGQAGLIQLRALAKEDDPVMRQRAAAALGHFKRTRHARLIESLLDDPDTNVRAKIMTSLGQNPQPQWLSHLIDRGLRDRAWRVRRSAALALGSYPNAQSAAALIPAASDVRSEVRAAAIDALEAHDDASLDTLLMLAPPSASHHNDVTRAVQSAVARLSTKHEDQLVSQLNERLPQMDPQDGQHLAFLMASCGNTGARKLLDMVQGDHTRLAFYAQRALEAHPQHVTPLISPDMEPERFQALPKTLAVRYIQIMGASAQPQDIDQLMALTHEPRNYVRAELMRVLGQFNSPQAHEAFILALEDPWEDVRAEAAHALGHHKVQRAVPHLTAMIQRHDVRMLSAIRALGQIGDPAALEVLHKALQHERSTVRQYACVALGQIGRTSSLNHLIILLNDKDELVRFYATRAINQIN